MGARRFRVEPTRRTVTGVHRADREIIRIAAAVIRREGTVLTVRKRGGVRFMLPGGKYEAGEAPLDCLARELMEELGVGFDVEEAISLGRFEAPAAEHPDATVVADVFVVSVAGEPEPRAEIETLCWVAPGAGEAPLLAQLLEEQVFPALAAAGLP